MKVKSMRILNMISAVSFLISSINLLIIPFISHKEELPVIAYVVASVFWLGLISGLCIQMLLTVNCKRLNLKSNDKKHKVLYIIAAVAFLLVIIFVLMNIKYTLVVTSCLFVFLLSIQEAIVIKRKGCLK